MSDNLGNNSTVDRCGTGTEDMEMTLAEVGIADINNIAVWKRLTGYIRKNLLFLGEPLSFASLYGCAFYETTWLSRSRTNKG